MKTARELLNEYGLTPNKALGQNFLVDEAAIEAIVSAAAEPALPMVEIGPGLGALTFPLAAAGLPMAAVELDAALADLLRARLPGNASVVNEDFMKTDIEGLAEKLGGDISVVGNLPYYITSPICMRLVTSKAPIRRMTLMMQSEAADRFTAQPGSKNYGPLTVLSRLQYDVSELIALSPASYYPQPDVSSSVLVFDRNGSELPAAMPRLLKCAFAMRRKTLLNNLSAMGLSKADAAGVISAAGLEPTVRAEALDPDDFVRLCRLIG